MASIYSIGCQCRFCRSRRQSFRREEFREQRAESGEPETGSRVAPGDRASLFFPVPVRLSPFRAAGALPLAVLRRLF